MDNHHINRSITCRTIEDDEVVEILVPLKFGDEEDSSSSSCCKFVQAPRSLRTMSSRRRRKEQRATEGGGGCLCGRNGHEAGQPCRLCSYRQELLTDNMGRLENEMLKYCSRNRGIQQQQQQPVASPSSSIEVEAPSVLDIAVDLIDNDDDIESLVSLSSSSSDMNPVKEDREERNDERDDDDESSSSSSSSKLPHKLLVLPRAA